MERERENAYAVRIQCWWRRMLAMRTKTRETPALAGEVQERAERDRGKATLVIQVRIQQPTTIPRYLA